jgi:hypothetical protein
MLTGGTLQSEGTPKKVLRQTSAGPFPGGDPTDVGDGVPDGYEPLLFLVEEGPRPADGTYPGDGSDYRPPSGP